MSSDSEFLMRMGEARHRLEQLYYESPPWEDLHDQNPFWDKKDGKLTTIKNTLTRRQEELFEILMLMSPNKDK